MVSDFLEKHALIPHFPPTVRSVQSREHAGPEEDREDHQQPGGAHGFQGVIPKSTEQIWPRRHFCPQPTTTQLQSTHVNETQVLLFLRWDRWMQPVCHLHPQLS